MRPVPPAVRPELGSPWTPIARRTPAIPRDLHNTPEGQYGPWGYGEINFAQWLDGKVAALFRRLRRRSSADRDHS
ncbi:MAG TPA: hypothetical protein VK923_15625 [Euzebyales bacterium]|nr:hypothetical protein [Euzebyales bacterium]